MRTSFKMLKERVVCKQESLVQVICSRDVETVLIKDIAQTILSLYKKSNKLERICKHESSSKNVKVVANILVCLQFSGKAALKRRITLSYKYRVSEVSEEKNTFCAFFHHKILIVGLIVKCYEPFSQ